MARVLLVEDDADMADAVSELLCDDGHELQLAMDADAARSALSTRAFDVVVLDWMLRGLTSEVVLTPLCALEQPPVTLLYSASPSARAVARAWSIPFLDKPFDVADFVAAIRDAVERQSRPVPPPTA